jgi:hypothetical protein
MSVRASASQLKQAKAVAKKVLKPKVRSSTIGSKEAERAVASSISSDGSDDDADDKGKRNGDEGMDDEPDLGSDDEEESAARRPEKCRRHSVSSYIASRFVSTCIQLTKLDEGNSIVLGDGKGMYYGLPEAADDDEPAGMEDDTSKVLKLHKDIIEAAEAEGAFYTARGEGAKKKVVECLLKFVCVRCKSNAAVWQGQWGFIPLAVQNHIGNGHAAARRRQSVKKVAKGRNSIKAFFGRTLVRAVASEQLCEKNGAILSGK